MSMIGKFWLIAVAFILRFCFLFLPAVCDAYFHCSAQASYRLWKTDNIWIVSHKTHIHSILVRKFVLERFAESKNTSLNTLYCSLNWKQSNNLRKNNTSYCALNLVTINSDKQTTTSCDWGYTSLLYILQ